MRNEKGNWPTVNVKGVLRSIERVFKTRNSQALTKDAYNRLYLLGGFIGHYNIGGFADYYSETSTLARDILHSYEVENPEHYTQDCFVRDYGATYCQSEVKLANGLRELATKYLPELEAHDNREERENDIATARSLLAKHGVTA